MVEWKKLGEVCTFHRGKTITAKDAVDGDIPVIAGGQTPSYYHNESNREEESITVAGSGAYAGFVSYWNQPIYVSDAFTIDPLKGLKHKYLFHWAKMNQEKIIAAQKGAGVPHVHGKDIANFLIPIPSLSEQSRIVSILDTFTSSISNLKQQIEERRKQYEYERDLLLDLEGKEGVEMKKLEEITTTIKVGPFGSLLHKSDYIKGGIPLVNPIHMNNGYIIKDESFSVSPELAAKLCNYFLKTNDIVFARRGEIGRCAIVTEKENNYICGTGSLIVRFKERINSKYMLFLFQTPLCKNYLEKSAIGGSMLNINCDIVGKMVNPIPSFQEQSRIVSILDTFEASIANLEEQLAMREKQYEYYRNQLLTFEGEEERGKT